MENEVVSKNFIEQIIEKDLEEGKCTKIVTRFPPEPNGYLHIGHAKSILLNYGLAKKYGGQFNLRFDDTNPMKEKTEFVESIRKDVEWLGADFEDHIFYASDYFDAMYEGAVKLIKKGKAYVCDLSAEEIREYRGTLKEPGKESPYRNRSIEENLDLFERMKNGEFEDGSKVLRAKIDMASGNINMRDPVIYRVARMSHHNTKDKWCIYPMYDFAHQHMRRIFVRAALFYPAGSACPQTDSVHILKTPGGGRHFRHLSRRGTGDRRRARLLSAGVECEHKPDSAFKLHSKCAAVC